jgi:hypothetical protein
MRRLGNAIIIAAVLHKDGTSKDTLDWLAAQGIELND